MATTGSVADAFNLQSVVKIRIRSRRFESLAGDELVFEIHVLCFGWVDDPQLIDCTIDLGLFF
jgi:hypothetical protein